MRISFLTVPVELCALAALFVSPVSAQSPSLREEPLCVENSPERQGQFGCSIVETKTLPSGLPAPLFWHIDRFATLDRARSAVGPTSMAFDAHGTSWLMSLESQTDSHHGGQHVTQVKLPPLPDVPTYSMRVLSAYIPSGMTSRVHFHSGVEAFYTVDGEQCLQTAERAYTLRKGQGLAVSAGVVMRLIATGPTPRRAFGLIVYDSSKPPTTRLPMDDASQLIPCPK